MTKYKVPKVKVISSSQPARWVASCSFYGRNWGWGNSYWFIYVHINKNHNFFLLQICAPPRSMRGIMCKDVWRILEDVCVCVTGLQSVKCVRIMRWWSYNILQLPLHNIVYVAYCYLFILIPPPPPFPPSDFLPGGAAPSCPDTPSTYVLKTC